jgi:hypothetical protein
MVKPIETQEPQWPSGPPSSPRNLSFLENPNIDHLLRAVVTLTMEMSVMRDRINSIEIVLTREGRSMADEINRLSLSSAQEAKRNADRKILIQSILWPFIDEKA